MGPTVAKEGGGLTQFVDKPIQGTGFVLKGQQEDYKEIGILK